MNGSWTVRIERMPLTLAVGVHHQERPPQPVQASLVIRGRAAAVPDGLADCLDYDPLLDWMRGEWAASPHTPLLETRINELLDFCFALDPRIDSVWVGLYKTALACGATAVGIERGVTRREWWHARAAGRRGVRAVGHAVAA